MGFGEVENRDMSHRCNQFHLHPSCEESAPAAAETIAIQGAFPRFNPLLAQLPQLLHSRSTARLDDRVEKMVEPAIYAPNCSVNLFSSLFKSLSPLRTSSIFSTECKTVV
jgi:hypothetical protein